MCIVGCARWRVLAHVMMYSRSLRMLLDRVEHAALGALERVGQQLVKLGPHVQALERTHGLAPDGPVTGSQGSNTGQVVAELKVVTSNKLCEPNASNCPNAPRHKHKERKHPRKKARTPKLLKLHEDAQRQSVERESASRPPPVLQLVGSQADSW